MRRCIALLSVLALAASLGVVVADESASVTLEGKLLCAKCTLHAEEANECQNVLVVETGDEAVHYYLSKNEVYEEFGSVCKGAKSVRVTGTVEEHDGHKWIDPAKITSLEAKG